MGPLSPYCLRWLRGGTVSSEHSTCTEQPGPSPACMLRTPTTFTERTATTTSRPRTSRTSSRICPGLAMQRAACAVVLAVAVMGTAVMAGEPGLTELNGQSFWKQFEHGFRGLEEAAMSQATHLEHILREAMTGGRPSGAKPDAHKPDAKADDDEEVLSTGVIPEIDEGPSVDDSSEETGTSDSGEDDEPSFPVFGLSGRLPTFPNLFSMMPWWNGPNVCMTREEFDETEPSKKKDDGEQGQSEEDAVNPFAFGDFHFSSCSETPTKYQCVTRAVNHGVKKKFVTTRRCCHGSRRVMGQPGCTMVEMSSLVDTAREMDGSLFAKMLTSSGLEDMVTPDRNVTLFVPTDDAMRDFFDGITEQNRVRRALGPRPLNPVVVGDEESFSADVPYLPVPEAPVALPVMGSKSEEPVQARNENQVPDVAAARREGKDKDPMASELADLDDPTLVLAHRVEGILDIQDDTRNDAILNSTAGTTIRVNVYPGLMGRTYTANCARVLKERPAKGGVVVQVDKVLRPVPRERTLATLLESDPRLTTMRRLMRVADMMDMLREAGPMTIFFPSDEAFKKMDPVLRTEMLKGEACVGSFIRSLVVKHTVCTAAARLRLRMPNLNGDFLTLERMPSDDGKLTLENVELGSRDIVASNGVLHLINEVIVPDSARPVKDVLRSRNLTRWYDLLEKAELLEELEHARNVTLFVPTAAALQTPEAEVLLAGDDKEALRNYLRYHIARQAVETDDMTHGQTLDTKLDGKPLRVNLFSTIPFLNGAVTSATVQCGRLESVDAKACGAVLHEVDRVLAPPSDSVMDLLRHREDLSTLHDIVKASSYEEYLSATKEFPPFTFLAPTNAGMEESLTAERLAQLKSDKKHADAFVQRHILPTSLCCNGVGVSSWLFTNRVRTLKEDLSHKVRKDSRNRVRIGDSVVKQCDKMATNGIMHVLDAPLVPPKTLLPSPSTSNNRRRTSNLEILLFGL